MTARVPLRQRPDDCGDVHRDKRNTRRPRRVQQDEIAHRFFIIGNVLQMRVIQVNHDGHRRDGPNKGEGIGEDVPGQTANRKEGVTEFGRGIDGFRRRKNPFDQRPCHAFTDCWAIGGIDSEAWFVDSSNRRSDRE